MTLARAIMAADASPLTVSALAALLDTWSAEPLVYGQSDCAISVFRFIADAHGDDRLIRRWQGTYAG